MKVPRPPPPPIASLGQELTLSRATLSAVSDHLSELIGFPISRSFPTYCVCLELRSLPSTGVTRLQPCSPKGCRVGLHIVLFEDCVTACTLALSPIRDTLTRGFSHFVTSMTAPIASGWSDCRVGLAPTGKAPPFHGAHPLRTSASISYFSREACFSATKALIRAVTMMHT
jgi:hypothetical protein